MKQQYKNIRTNKGILKNWLSLPIPENTKKLLSILAMDWIGTNGYMFTVSHAEDVFVAHHHSNLEMFTHIDDLPKFIDTIDALYIFKNHNLYLKDTLVTANNKKRRADVLADLIPGNVNDRESSPNILFFPRKKRTSGKKTVKPQQQYQEEEEEE
ncbi:hypothetical protein K501DRAFT_258761 [Backusella circina FSU 941]|nr:hypothetical protein K501DRAFT_258761 [Backusella circina FSU 941]